MDYSRGDRADRLAADYVAGLLRGGARRRFEALLPAHPTLRTAVDQWNSRLMPLTQSLDPVRPPKAVWKQISARIGSASPAPEPAARTGWRGQLAFWRTLAAMGAVAALSLSVLLASPETARAPVVVVLQAAGDAGAAAPASFVASISGDGRALVTRPLLNVNVQADRALELWAVPGSGAPRSLGLISSQGATVLKKGKLLTDTAALAVSLEPPGGSPTGAPTGPVLYVGKLL